jgi:hypothetical protein
MTERPSNNSLLPPSIRKYLEESEEQIQAIKTVNDIKEVVGADAALLLVGERIPAICRLYATLVQEHERIIKEKFHLIGHYQALDASVTKFFEATQKVLDGLNAQDQILEQSRQRVEAELLRDLDELKNAIGQAQLISAFDRRRVHLASPVPSSSGNHGSVSTMAPGPVARSNVPSEPDGLVRPLSKKELRKRDGHRCNECGETGHWQCDHYSYRCTLCGKNAPGHNSGSRWCPDYRPTPRNTSPDQYDALLDDGDYDDYLWGDEGEHNLNT